MAYFIFLLIIFFLILIYMDSNLMVKDLELVDDKLKVDEEIKIIHISDFHDGLKFRDSKYIRDKIIEKNPDIIIISGDLIDSRRTNINISIDFLNQIKDICPIFYAFGNHESRVKESVELNEAGIERGINILRNERMDFTIKGVTFNIIGIDDLDFTHLYANKEERGTYSYGLVNSLKRDGKYNILIFHRPEYLKYLQKTGVNLIFSGHAHGGQIRIFNRGLFAPGQGFFPYYTSGIYEINGTYQLVSRGIGNSNFPLRIFNRPEIISLTLKGVS